MLQYTQKRPKGLNAPPLKPLNIADNWSDPAPSMKPPEPNKIGNVPYNALLYNLDYLSDLFHAVVIDPDVVDLIKRLTPPFEERNMTRKSITLTLMGERDVFSVVVWVIPVFQDGILVAQLFAADSFQQAKLIEQRPPAKMDSYDFQKPTL